MRQVYQKLGILGKTYWLDDGLTDRRITKRQYNDFVLKNKVAKEVARQLNKSNRK